jgi:tetratricopeptide (TPR) repeat protein
MEDAAAAYRRALAVNPRHAEAHNNLGNILPRGALAEAIDSWRQAIALRPGYPEALANLGAALTALDRLEEAVEALRASLQSRPNHADTLVQLAETQRLAGRPRESLSAVQRGLQAEPRHARLQIQKARALSALQRPDEALVIIRQAAADSAGDANIAAELAQQLEYAGESDEATRRGTRSCASTPPTDALAGLIGLNVRTCAGTSERARQSPIAWTAVGGPAVLHWPGDQADRDRDYGRAMAHYDAATAFARRNWQAGMAFDLEALRALSTGRSPSRQRCCGGSRISATIAGAVVRRGHASGTRLRADPCQPCRGCRCRRTERSRRSPAICRNFSPAEGLSAKAIRHVCGIWAGRPRAGLLTVISSGSGRLRQTNPGSSTSTRSISAISA